MQSSGLDAATAATRVIQVAQQQPAPIRVPIGPDAEQLMKAVHEQTDEELDALRMRVAGLDSHVGPRLYLSERQMRHVGA
jgi:hypothetical protein